MFITLYIIFLFYFTIDPVYLIVNSINDIHKIEGHIAFTALLKGVKTPRKRKHDGESTS